jgi:hypothetical protein
MRDWPVESRLAAVRLTSPAESMKKRKLKELLAR